MDRLLLAALARPDTLIQQLQPAAGPYMMGNDTSVGGDEIKTRYALEILRRYKPAFMTIHLSSLDDAQHAHAPFSPEADRTLEAIDGMVARLAQRPSPTTPPRCWCGLRSRIHEHLALLNLYIPFLQAGLIQATVNPQTRLPIIDSWKAEPWMAGGMAAIMLHDSSDRQTEQQVRALLDKLAADPNNGIAEILDRNAIAEARSLPGRGLPGDSQARLLPRRRNQWRPGDEIPGNRGSHGFSPEYPEMRASFFAWGPESPIIAISGGRHAADCAHRRQDSERAHADGKSCAAQRPALTQQNASAPESTFPNGVASWVLHPRRVFVFAARVGSTRTI